MIPVPKYSLNFIRGKYEGFLEPFQDWNVIS
jgi:hypothetical protein